MSFQATRHVWDTSKRSGGELLLLLAIADFANSHGECWAGIEKIAQRARLTPKYAARLIKKMATGKDAELSISKPKKSTVYALLGMTQKGESSQKDDCELSPTEDQSSQQESANFNPEEAKVSPEKVKVRNQKGESSQQSEAETVPSAEPNCIEPVSNCIEPVKENEQQPPSPYDHLTTSEKARRSKQLAQLVIAHQDATDDNERATIRQQIESITAEIRAEVWPTTGPVIDGRGGGAAGVDSDRPGDATGVRSDRDARGLLPDQTRHDMAGHERHASARGAD